MVVLRPGRAARAVYVHLPFCRRRCFYCDFPVVVVGESPVDKAADRYVNLLRREILAGPDRPMGADGLDSVYFGGGTPSLTPPALLDQVIWALRARFGLMPNFECTLEMDPGTFDEKRLQEFVDIGVTRVSLGAQSFDDDLLLACNRAHTVQETDTAIGLLSHTQTVHGVPLEFSVDHIGGLPGQTQGSWRTSLERAAGCGAHHVSVYDLQIEPRTAFGKWFEQGRLDIPPEEDAAGMFRMASQAQQKSVWGVRWDETGRDMMGWDRMRRHRWRHDRTGRGGGKVTDFCPRAGAPHDYLLCCVVSRVQIGG